MSASRWFGRPRNTLFDLLVRFPRKDIFPLDDELAFVWVRFIRDPDNPAHFLLERCPWGSLGNEPRWVPNYWEDVFQWSSFLSKAQTFMLTNCILLAQPFVFRLCREVWANYWSRNVEVDYNYAVYYVPQSEPNVFCSSASIVLQVYATYPITGVP